MDANWRSSSHLRYHTTTGLHNFSTWTGPYRGEYLQVDLSENFVVSSYVVEGHRTTNNDRYNSPKKGYLLGSTDNKRWNLIHTFELSSNDANEYYTAEYGYKTIVNHTDKTFKCKGRYFRFVIEKLFPGCDGYASLYNLRLLGVKESEASLGNGQSTTTFVNDYTALASPENLTRHAVGNSTYLAQNAPEPFPQSRFTASSYESNSYHPKLAFSQLSGDTAGWRSKGSLYNTSTGTYYGTNLTGIYKGEWIQIDLSDNIFADSYNLAGWYHSTQSNHNSSPKKGYLLSSLDGKDWRLAHTFDYAGDHADYTIDPSNNRSVGNNKITNNENAIGRYWRFVVEKLFPGCQDYAVIMNLAVIGVKHPSQTIQGEVTKTTQDNTIYTLDVTPYVLTNYSTTDYAPGSTLTGHEYSASSYQGSSYKAERAFRSYYSGAWRSYGQKYSTTNGVYYGPYITNGYKGEWIQVDLSENVFADSYSVSGWLHSTQTYHNSSPKKGYLLSSLDGNLWRLAHTFDIAGDHADYTYNDTDKNGIINHKITNNKNAIGRYWRFVIEKLFPGCQSYTAIHQFVIYGGKETELTTGDGASNEQLKLYSTPTTASDFTNGWQLGNYTLEQIPMNHMNQTFTASSWSDNNYLPKEAFGRYSHADNYWRSYGTEYNTTSGTYFGSKRTGDYPGEWIQVDLSENYFANNYAVSGYLHTTDSYHNSSPKKGYLLSSLDGKKWRLAHTFDISGDHADYVYTVSDGYSYVTHDISNNSNAIGRYWRFVTEKIFPGNQGHVSMSKLSINGAKQTDIIEGNVVVDNSRNNVIYKLNATPYDLFNNFSELTGQVYRASTHGTTSGNNQVSNTFDGFIDTYKWYSRSQYNAGSGLYYGSKFTGPYHGEWIQVDLSENVFAGSYIISGYKHTGDSNHNSSPKKGYLLSSLDGKDWRLAHTFDITGDHADYAYNTNDGYGYITHDISNNGNAIGRYWRFVTEKVFPGNGGYVWIGQFTVLGVKYPSEVTVDSGALTTTFTNKIRTKATPYDLFNNFSELTGQVYSASSHNSTSGDYQISNTFNGFQDELKWHSKNQYNAGSGVYYGTKFTGPYHGEWIQVDLSENVFAGSYVISGRMNTNNSYHNSAPKKGYLLSSLDGKDWRLAHTFDISGDNADYVHNATDGYGYVTHDISNNSNAVGRYWRFVTEKVFPGNSSHVWISQFTVLGVKYPSETIEGELVIDVSNNNPGYTLNLTPYDLFNNFSKLTGQVYSASSHQSTSGNYQISNTFDGFQDDLKWHSKKQYNAASGLYYGTKFTGPYQGEWIQVDLSENVFAGSYVISGRLHSGDSYHNSSPKKGYLLSSLDGKDWRLAHTFDILGDHADYVYNTTDGYGFIQHDISNNSNAIGRYWRFVTEKVFPGNGEYVWISQFSVLGVKYPSEVTFSNLAIDPSLNISKVLPADMTTIYDLVSSNSTLTGQVYSGSNLDSNYPPSEAFDGILDNWESHWKGASQYNSSSGNYYGTKFTGIYPGEWLQVDLSENVIIGEYEIYPPYHSTYYKRAPKKSYLLSSLDGEKWNLVHTHDVNTFNDSYGTYQGKVSYELSGENCKGRYFRIVTEKVFSTTTVSIAELIIKGIRANETHITSQSLANSYNTFTNKTTPYKIYTRALRHTTDPYVISSEKTTLNNVDIVSTSSTITNQTYTATYGTAANAFDNSGNTEWSTDASSNYGIISSLITNEPNFTSWTAATDGVLTTFSENITANTIDKSNFSIYDSSENITVNIHSVEISNGKLLVKPLTGYVYNNAITAYDLTSTSSTLYGTRGEITFSSQYNHANHDWLHAFNDTSDGPAVTASGSYSGGNPVGAPDTVISGVTYNGHWVQIDVGQNVFVKTFEYTNRDAYQNNEWDTLLLAGSKDGTTWDLLWRETGRAQTTSAAKETYAVNATDVYSQFRWLCEKNNGGGYAWNSMEMTLLGQKESEASLVTFAASKLNDYRITYTKPLNQDNQLKGVTNGVAVQSFVLEDGAVTGRGEFAILPLSLNEPSFTSSQVVSGKLEYTFSENLQAGAGGFDITDFQLIEPSGNVVDLSSNITGIVGGKLVIGTYPAGFHLQGNNYALSGSNAAHSGTLAYSWSTQFNTTSYRGDYFHDGNNSNRWSSVINYSSGTYTGGVSTATTNAGTITGEYVQIDTGKMSILSHFTYFKSSDPSQEITTGSLVGSKDNVTWDVITSFSYDVNNDPDEVTKNISTQAEYRYYRLIYSAVNGGNKASCNEWTIFGHIRDDYYIGETISDKNYMLVYNKNSTNNKNIIGATNNVAINSFRIDNNLLIGRGGVTNIGQYNGSTSTTLTDTSTYKGEYIQVDIGKNVIINNYAINVKSFNGNDNPKSWMLVGSLNGSDWTKLDEVFNTTLLSNYVGGVTSTKVRYLRLIVNRGGAAKHIKISEFKVNGVEIRLEGQTYSASIDNGDANTVFDNSIATSWNTSSAYNYNGIDTAAANEATYSSIQLHTDASGNNKIELTFSADLSSNDLKFSDFTVNETDFSASIPVLADISGGKLIIEKQANVAGSVYYEDFDDQAYLGDVATADIVQGGIKNAISFQPVETRREVQMVNGASISYHANYHSITEYNGKYYMSTATSVVDELDVSNNTLTRIATSGGRVKGGMAFFAYNGSLYFYGGGENANETTDTQLDSYNLSTDTWTFNISTTGPAPRHYNGGFVVEGSVLYVSGGTKSTTTSKLDLTTMAWTTIDTTAGNIIATPHFVYNNRLYRYGSSSTWYARSGGLQYLDLANPGNGWTSVTINDPNNVRTHVDQRSGFSGARRGAKGVAVKDGKMYYVSGWDEYFTYTGYYTNILHYIDLTNNTVYEIQSGMTFPDSVARHQHFFKGDILYLFAGGTLNDNGLVNSYSPNIYKLDITKTATQYGYRLQGDNTATPPKIWRITNQTFLAVSFWFKRSNTSGTIFDSYNSTDSNATYSGGDGQKDRMKIVSGKPRLRTRSPANIERWYQNGIQCSTPAASEHHGTDGHTAMHGDSWHHIYVEFKTPNDRIQFFANGLSSSLNADSGSLDEVRFYNTSVSEAHILEMAQGWNGMYPGASFDKTDYLIEYKKNANPSHNIYDVNNTSVPINDFILRNGSLISRGTNFGHYSGSTITTLVDSSTSTGEYIEVNMGQETYIINYEIHVPPSNSHPDDNVYPKSWTLLGSTDGSSWTKIHDVSDYTGWTTNSSYGSGYQVSYLTEIKNIVAQYYRLIINKTYGKVGYTSVAELLIMGVKHTSETAGVTQTKTASLGTAANAFDDSISTAWDTSSSPSYGTLASTVTNEPIFSSGTINGSSQIELTFDTNIDISGTFNKTNLIVTNTSFDQQAYNATIDSGKLLLTFSPDQLPGLDTIFFENFNDQTTTDPLGDVGSIVAGGHDGLGYALQRNTSNQNHTGVCWEQTTIAENIKTIAFWYIIDETDLTGSWNNVMWLYHGGSYTYVLRFASDNHLGQGTSHGGHQVEKYYVDGVLCDGANLVTSYDTDITLSGNAIEESSFQGTWRHIVLEFKDPLNDPNVSNSAVSKIRWLTENSGGYSLKSRIDDIRFYDQALTQAQITLLATNGMVGTFSGSLSDYNIQYTKTNNGNLVNASHTSVGVNSFALINGTITNRGDDGIGEYTGSTSTTLPDSSTYNGEWVQIDVGQTILMTSISLVVPNKTKYSNPKSWKLLISQDNTNWVEALDVSGNTVWDSGFASASTDYTGFQIGKNLTNLYIGRYFKVIVNSVIGPSNHVKINEVVIKGVSHTQETQSVAGDHPILYTATESSNTTSQTTSVTTTTHNTDDTTVTTVTETTVDISANTVTKTTTKETITTVVSGVSQPTVTASNNTTSTTDSTVTTTTHNADDTTITTVTETTIDIATNTVTTTTTKRTVTTLVSGVTLNTATPSSVTTVDSDTTALTTTYNNNDTSVRTVVNKTVDISANTDTTTNLNTIVTTTITGITVTSQSGSNFIPNKVFDASGVAVPALKSIYEQLMNVKGRAQIMQSRDFTSSPMPSAQTITGGFPFIPGDKLVMYLRPKIVFAQATFPEQFTSLIGFGGVTFGEPVVDTALASGGAITGQTYTESSKYSDTYAGSKLFDGSTTTFWITASNTYGTDGVATSGSTTIHADDGGGTYTGHYVQIQFANSVAIEDIKITPRYGGGGGAGEPKEFRILSSDDGSTFRVAYSVAEGELNNDWSLWSTQTFHLPNLRNASSKGKYWRIAVGKITTGNKVQLAKVELIGNLTSTLIGNDIGAPIVTGGGSGPDLASQIYHEDFQDQSYDGTVTGAPVVSVTGHTGQTTYVVETKISATERWEQTGYSTAKTFSFWHKYIAGGKTSGTYIFEKLINGGYTAIYYTTSNSTLNFEGYNTANSTFYLNGVAQNSNGSISHDATQWTHYCFVFNDTNATGKINWGHPGRGYESSTVYHTNGYFDDVRIFNEELTASQIADLAAGENGNSGKNHPYDIASSNSTLSGQTYTASSKYNNASRYFAHDAFDGVITGVIDSWVSAANTYSNGSHNYTNANTTTDGYAGEWVQVDIGQDIVLKSFQIYPRQASGELNMAPKNMRLFSSIDGTNWTQVKDWTGLTTNDWYPSSTWSSVGPYTTTTTGRYFRLVINENIGNSTYTQIGEIELKGLTAAEEAANQALVRGDPITTTYPTSTISNGYPTTGSILDISGLETNITKLSSTFPALFPGNATSGPEAEATKFGWVGSANADTLSLETTDEKDTRTMDLHIWKITITL